MAALLPLVQQLLSGFAPQDLNASAPNVTHVSSTTGTPPLSLSSLITLVLSFSALRDWMKLVVLGGIIEMCRRFVFGGFNKFIGSFFITACFEEQDSSYEWMMVWLSKQPSWSKARQVQVSTSSFANNAAIFVDGEDDINTRFKSSRRLAYLPSLSTTYNLWYRNRWMTITRVQNQTGLWGSKEQTLYVSIMTRDHGILNSLLQEARRDYILAQEHKMCVYVSDTSNNWRHVACREKRSMQSIILDPGVKDVLIEDAKDFLRSKEWYAERGIPFRRGYLLYGVPGAGKTSLIHAISGELGLDVYILSLSRIGLDDSALSELVNALPQRCVALMEDIDAAFTNGLNREPIGTATDTQEVDSKPMPGAPPPPPTTSRLSLSGLLNALDGVGAQEGRILFATTNKYSVLDPALCRPGRMDLHIEFKLASKFQARQLFNRFYLPKDDPDTIETGNDKEEGSEDSGYDSTEKNPDSNACVPTFGTKHSARGPQLEPKAIRELAVRFASACPEREISMATLQGFLMSYKTRPVEAVADVKGWVEKERSEKVNKK
ncbi:P-loop containing nucleoside triphosphate hydrolase protein [Roridomyces roridus]|uniref:P-loop containing nucleoside triphosphate hydrolase protein n=1 Tax=Roridomyces roridus TaxID=1738132 RepID=A0AAD7FHU5_9AGAR|nr:P-loop containing nucleoside triphosphate hydrolase protein [Roridomyces roridus]